jgi:hypothetical protein
LLYCGKSDRSCAFDIYAPILFKRIAGIIAHDMDAGS